MEWHWKQGFELVLTHRLCPDNSSIFHNLSSLMPHLNLALLQSLVTMLYLRMDTVRNSRSGVYEISINSFLALLCLSTLILVIKLLLWPLWSSLFLYLSIATESLCFHLQMNLCLVFLNIILVSSSLRCYFWILGFCLPWFLKGRINSTTFC